MADTTIRQSDGELYVPLKAVDLGDGTYAAAVTIPAAAGLGLVGIKGGAPSIITVSLTNANTQYSASVAAGIGLEFRARTQVDVRFAFETGKVADSTEPYATLRAGEAFFTGPVEACTLYLASSVAGTVVEVLTYQVA